MMQDQSDDTSVLEGISAEFKAIRDSMTEEQETREKVRLAVKDLHDEVKEVIIVLQCVHKARDSAGQACQRARLHLPRIQSLIKGLSHAFPADLYFRHHDQFKIACQSLSLMGAFVHYLETGDLINRTQLACMLDTAESQSNGFHITLEDMLLGFLQLASELSRLAVNAVTYGDFQLPFSISAFIGQLNSAFQLLNLKNDFLRRRYDALKYDVKKVEEVVYDLSIRGLRPSSVE